MTISPLMISIRDDELVGAARRADPLGVLTVWSSQARRAIPHLTEQSTDVRGFQVLVEGIRLWSNFVNGGFHASSDSGLPQFFMLVEQAFAQTISRQPQCEWSLPGARRLRSRSDDQPCISLEDSSWHLTRDQLASGIWGRYAGAARRAGLLENNMELLSEDTQTAADNTSQLTGKASDRLLDLANRAMHGETVELPTHGNDLLLHMLVKTWNEIPLGRHLYEKLILSHDLNRSLAERLIDVELLNHRSVLENASFELKSHRYELRRLIDCENLLAVLEDIFYRLCGSKGQSLQTAADSLPIDRHELENARYSFSQYGESRFNEVDTSSNLNLARWILNHHKTVCEERKRSTWVWEEQGRLHSDIEPDKPVEEDCKVGLRWRNDYYLWPLQCIAKQLDDLNHE